MSFEVDDGAAPRSPTMDDLQLTIKSDGKGYLNRAADQQWFVDVDEATFLVDREATKLAIAPGDRDGRCYALSREADYGADLSTEGVLTALGLDPDPEALPQWFTPVWDDDLEAAVVDLSALVDAEPETSDAACQECGESHDGGECWDENDGETDGTTDEDDRPTCYACETRIDEFGVEENGHPTCPSCGENPLPPVGDAPEEDATDNDGPEAVAYWLSLKIAPGQTYALEASEIAENVPQSTMKVTHDLREIDEDDDEFSIEYQEREGKAGIWRIERADEGSEANTAEPPTKTEQARTIVKEDGVKGLTELADRLGVTPGQARTVAMNADVYGRLRDDDIERPGVDR